MPRYLQSELDAAVRLAREAGEVILGWYKSGTAVEYKAGDEPVTEADRAADDLIRSGLHALFPDDGLLTEESEDDLSRLDRERVWIVDPLDGTTEFIDRTDEFAVHIALAVGGSPLLGVVYQPAMGQLYHAVQGRGAYRVRDGQTLRMRVSAVADPARMRLVASRSHYSGVVESARLKLGIESVVRVGSVGIKVGWVASGDCDVYLATSVAKEWDLCAPHAVLLEAGGTLTNLCGEPLIYNKRDIAGCRGVAGSNGLVHSQILEALAPFLDRAKE